MTPAKKRRIVHTSPIRAAYGVHAVSSSTSSQDPRRRDCSSRDVGVGTPLNIDEQDEIHFPVPEHAEQQADNHGETNNPDSENDGDADSSTSDAIQLSETLGVLLGVLARNGHTPIVSDIISILGDQQFDLSHFTSKCMTSKDCLSMLNHTFHDKVENEDGRLIME